MLNSQNTQQPTPVELLAIANKIAVEAADFAFNARKVGARVAATKSSDTDIVTQTDRDTEALVRQLVWAARPDDGIVGEEGENLVGTSGLNWVVDPIDGTVNFLYGIPVWAVSVAVVIGDPLPGQYQVLAGVVVNPTIGEVFQAARGGGATLNGEPIRVNRGVSLAGALLGTGFSYSAECRVAQGRLMGLLLPRVRDIRRAGAASLDLCSVAAGRLDAYFERGTHIWDHAAGVLIVREAGGIVGGGLADGIANNFEGRVLPEGAELVLSAGDEALYQELVTLIS